MKLLPCPFCGSTDVSMRIESPPVAWVGCDGCDTQGPTRVTASEATGAWNLRSNVVCSACGIVEGHAMDCPIYLARKPCPSCGNIEGEHASYCGAPR